MVHGPSPHSSHEALIRHRSPAWRSIRSVLPVGAVIGIGLLAFSWGRWNEEPRPQPSRATFEPMVFETGEGEDARTRPGARVHADFFRGFVPLLGRFPTSEELAGFRPAVVILSDSEWRLLFSGQPAVIGATLVLDGCDVPIVGVAELALAPEGAGGIWIAGRSPLETSRP